MNALQPFAYQKPSDLPEACKLLSAGGAGARILSGGTDLLIRLKQGLCNPEILIDIKGLPELNGVSHEPDRGLVLGSGLLLHRIETDPLVARWCPALAHAAARVASYPIRWMGTLGGNLCQETMCWYYNQSALWRHSLPRCFKAGGEECHVVRRPGVCHSVYRGDLAVLLLALDAEVTMASQQGERTISLASLFRTRGEAPLAVEPGEVLRSVLLPNRALGRRVSFQKHSFRKGVDYPQASAAVSLIGDSAEALNPRTARVIMGALGPAPVRCTEAEKVLVEFWGREELREKLAAVLEPYAGPVYNIAHGWPGYRRKMGALMVRRALEELLAQPPGGKT